MGVSGAGKSTIADALASRLGVPYLDADDLHPPANIARMAAGVPLRDVDRWPWLDQVGAWLAGRRAGGGVVACSALRRVYRDRLRDAVPELRTLHLDADPALLRARLAARTDHFLPPSLLDSQLATLEPLGADERGAVLDAAGGIERLLDEAESVVAAPGRTA